MDDVRERVAILDEVISLKERRVMFLVDAESERVRSIEGLFQALPFPGREAGFKSLGRFIISDGMVVASISSGTTVTGVDTVLVLSIFSVL